MAPVRRDLTAWSGNTEAYKRQMRQGDKVTPFDLTGSKLVFRATYGDQVIRKATDVPGSGFAIVDAANGIYRLDFTVAETRGWPDKTQLYYEMERWIGDVQRSFSYGIITVTSWVNDDVDP